MSDLTWRQTRCAGQSNYAATCPVTGAEFGVWPHDGGWRPTVRLPWRAWDYTERALCSQVWRTVAEAKRAVAQHAHWIEIEHATRPVA